jgi:hypothetical protein
MAFDWVRPGGRMAVIGIYQHLHDREGQQGRPGQRRQAGVRGGAGARHRHDGTVNQKRVRPPPDSAPTRPPAASTSWRTIASPMPAPPLVTSRDLSTR